MPLISSCHVEFGGSAHGTILHIGLGQLPRLALPFPESAILSWVDEADFIVDGIRGLGTGGALALVVLFFTTLEYEGPRAFSKAFLADLSLSSSSKTCCLRSSTSASNLSEEIW